MSVKQILKKSSCCPKCWSVEFITEPNQYDVLRFDNGHFEIEHSEFCDEFKIFCRECGAEINERASEAKNKVAVI